MLKATGLMRVACSGKMRWQILEKFFISYDTIQEAILTRARKLK